MLCSKIILNNFKFIILFCLVMSSIPIAYSI